MQFSFSFIILIIFASIIPIFTLNKKFDLLQRFLFFKLPKTSFSFAILSKTLIYFLLAGKLYFTLYILSYIILNQILLSAISALILLGIIIIVLYIFWHLKSKNQNVIMTILGMSLVLILSIAFSVICIILLANTLINFQINERFINIVKLSSKYFLLSFLFSTLSFSFAKIISFFLLKIKLINNKIQHSLYVFFHISSKIPTIFIYFLPYLILKIYSSQSFLAKNHLIQESFLLFFITIFYSIVLTHRIIDHSFSTPINILNKNNITFITTFASTFFEMNIIIQLIFFLMNSKQNIISIFIYALQTQDYQSIFFIGLIYLILYTIYFIYIRYLAHLSTNLLQP